MPPASPNGSRSGPAKAGVVLAKDARFTRSGKYTAWLSKVKHDGARARFLASAVRRFFTIDFDRQAFYHARGESDKDINAFIPFHEILEVVSAQDRQSSLRRSSSSSLLSWGQGDREEFLFTVVTAKRRLAVKAESAVDQTAWVTALNAARLIGRETSARAGRGGGMEACRPGEPLPKEVPASPASTTGNASTSAGSRRSTESSSESCSDGPPSGRQSPSASELQEPSLHHEDVLLEGTEAAEAAALEARDFGFDEDDEVCQTASAASSRGTEAAEAAALEARDFGFDGDDEVCQTASAASSRAPSCAPEPAPSPGQRAPEVAREEEEAAEYLSAEDAARIAADLNLLKRQCRRQPDRARRSAARPDEIDTADDGDGRSSRTADDLGLRRASPADLGKALDEDQTARIAADLALLGKVPRPGKQPQRGLESRQ